VPVLIPRTRRPSAPASSPTHLSTLPQRPNGPTSAAKFRQRRRLDLPLLAASTPFQHRCFAVPFETRSERFVGARRCSSEAAAGCCGCRGCRHSLTVSESPAGESRPLSRFVRCALATRSGDRHRSRGAGGACPRSWRANDWGRSFSLGALCSTAGTVRIRWRRWDVRGCCGVPFADASLILRRYGVSAPDSSRSGCGEIARRGSTFSRPPFLTCSSEIAAKRSGRQREAFGGQQFG
jgi:hypothetical protein